MATQIIGTSTITKPQQLAPLLLNWRKKKNLTQDAAGEKLKLTSGMYGHYERGNAYPPGDTAARMSATLGVQVQPMNRRTSGQNTLSKKPLFERTKRHVQKHTMAAPEKTTQEALLSEHMLKLLPFVGLPMIEQIDQEKCDLLIGQAVRLLKNSINL